jgi:hypothetical protein
MGVSFYQNRVLRSLQYGWQLAIDVADNSVALGLFLK